jgi:hypothetical protein
MSNCPGCEQPMIDGQTFNGLLQCHWDCTDATRAKMGNRNADDLIQLRINARLARDGVNSTHRLFEQLGGKVL